MKLKIVFWSVLLCFITFGIILVFSNIYEMTQKLKSQTETSLYPDIDLKAIPSIAKAMESLAQSSSSARPLTSQELNHRYKAAQKLFLKFPNAHKLYVKQCLSCHGLEGQGGKVLATLSTRMNPRKSVYLVPPLKAHTISSNLDDFFASASKRNKPHLPKNLLTAETKDILELQQYLKELTLH